MINVVLILVMYTVGRCIPSSSLHIILKFPLKESTIQDSSRFPIFTFDSTCSSLWATRVTITWVAHHNTDFGYLLLSALYKQRSYYHIPSLVQVDDQQNVSQCLYILLKFWIFFELALFIQRLFKCIDVIIHYPWWQDGGDEGGMRGGRGGNGGNGVGGGQRRRFNYSREVCQWHLRNMFCSQSFLNCQGIFSSSLLLCIYIFEANLSISILGFWYLGGTKYKGEYKAMLVKQCKYKSYVQIPYRRAQSPLILTL